MKVIYPTNMTALVLRSIACPVIIGFMGEAYGDTCPQFEYDNQSWPELIVDAIAWSAFFATVALISFARNNVWRFVAAAVFIPLFVFTLFAAALVGMWMDGTSL